MLGTDLGVIVTSMNRTKLTDSPGVGPYILM